MPGADATETPGIPATGVKTRQFCNLRRAPRGEFLPLYSIHDTPTCRDHLDAARRGVLRLDRRVRDAVPRVRPRAGGAVERHADARGRRRSRRGRAGRRRRLPAAARARRRSARIVDNLRKAKVDSAHQRACCSSRPASPRRTGARCRRSATPSLDFKKSGKPVYAYLEYGGDRDYYLASAADKVFLMPSSPLDLDRRRHLRAVPARHARQDRRLPGPAPRRRLQDARRTPSPRRASRRRTGRWTCRSTATSTSRSCAASPRRGRRPRPRSAR